MKTLQAQNGETITLEDDHATYFLARHRKETPSQMEYREVEPLQDVIAKVQADISKDDLPLCVERPGSVLNRLIRNAARRERNAVLRELCGTSARAAREDMGI